jgi:hypothetical protein
MKNSLQGCLGCAGLLFAVFLLLQAFVSCFGDDELSQCHKTKVYGHKRDTGEWPGGNLSAKYLQDCMDALEIGR